MRRSMLLLLTLALCLTGCTSMLEGDHLSANPHVNQTVVSNDPSVLRAENYQGLVNGLLYFVSQGMESGTIRLTKYTGDPELDLASVCAEVREEDPLGCYALDNISYHYNLIVSYYECTFSLTYRRTPAQLMALRTVSGASAIREELQQALQTHQSEVALRIPTYYAQEDTLSALLGETYGAIGPAALGMPQVTITLYPQGNSTATQRIAELVFTYDQTQAELTRQSQRVIELATQLSSAPYDSPSEAASAFADALTYRPGASSSVYAALSGGGADSLGVALAYQILCAQYGLTCQVIHGTLDHAPHSWNVVEVDRVFRHIDATTQAHPLRSDGEMSGYEWDADAYPACPQTSPSGS